MRKSFLLFITLIISHQHVFAEGNVYIVQPGDTLSSIAEKLALGFPDKHVYGKRGTLAKLVDLNPEIKNPHFLKNSKTIFIGDLTILDEKERQNEIVAEDKVKQLITNDKGQLVVPEELKASDVQPHLDDQKKAEEAKLAEEKKAVEEQKKAQDEARLVEEKHKADEEQQKAAQLKAAEEQMAAEQARLANDNRLAEEKKKAEEQKIAEDQKKAAEFKATEEQKKAQDEARLVEEKRKADEAKMAAEQAKLAEEARKLADEKRRAEEQRQNEVDPNDLVSNIHFSLGYQYFRIDSNDNVSKAGATLISALCPTQRLSWKIDWSSKWSTIVEFTSIQEETLPIVQSGATLSSGALGISTRFSFGVSRNLGGAGRLDLLVSSFENKFTRAVSATNIVIDRVTLPEAIINYSYDLVNFKYGNIGTMVSLGYLGGGAGPGIGYSVKPGTDKNMSMYFEHKLRKFDLNIKGEFFYGIKDQDSSISTKEEKNIGGVLGVTWRFD